MEKFLDSEVKNFEIFEDNEQEINAEKRNSRVRQWVGTWNNPKMTDEEFQQHFQNLYEEEYVQYAIFQRECGEEKHTEHFQFFVDFRNPQYFKKVKEKLLPYGCHFAPMRSTAKRCKEYCSKSDTRVSGPYEIGEFENEAQRSDLTNAIMLLRGGTPFEIVKEIYPNQSVMYRTKLLAEEEDYKKKAFMNVFRNVEVTYIYGEPGTGKTRSVYRKYGLREGELFRISTYEKYLFHGYDRHQVILFDEFESQVKITEMNQYLDIYPLRLRALGNSVPACYTKVYITSNLSPSEQYKSLESTGSDKLKKAFLRRLHHVIYVDGKGKEHKEKETLFRDLSDEEIELPGLTRTIDKTIYYNRQGIITRIESKEKVEQIGLCEIPIEETEDLPW